MRIRTTHFGRSSASWSALPYEKRIQKLKSANSTQALFDLMQQLNEQMNTSFILVTHDFDLAGRMQHRLRLVDGVLLRE